MPEDKSNDSKGFGGLGSMVSDVNELKSAAEHASPQNVVDDVAEEAKRRLEGDRAKTTTPGIGAGPKVMGSSGPKSGGGVKVLLWVGAAIIFLVWIADRNSPSRPSSGSTTNATRSSAPQPSKSNLPSMTRPPVGTSHAHSTSEIRWCLAEDIKIESIRSTLDTNTHIDKFNARVGDYNSRCGKYRYRSGTLERARRDIETVRATIVAQALAGLRVRSRPVPNAVVQDIQRGLSNLDYSPGPVDGLFGVRTKQAIEQFQRDQGLGVTGIADKQLIDEISIVTTGTSAESPRSAEGDKGGPDTSSFIDQIDAQIWLNDMSARLARTVQDQQVRLKILRQVHYEALRADLAPELVLAVIDVASGFDDSAIAESGARGLMQIMPFWLDEMGRPDDNLLHIDTNLRFGCTILNYYLELEHGDLRRALGRYSGAQGNSDFANKVLDRLRKRWYRI